MLSGKHRVIPPQLADRFRDNQQRFGDKRQTRRFTPASLVQNPDIR
jgi:hypothetical protein